MVQSHSMESHFPGPYLPWLEKPYPDLHSTCNKNAGPTCIRHCCAAQSTFLTLSNLCGVQAQGSTHGTMGDTAVEQVRDTQAQVQQLEERLKQA